MISRLVFSIFLAVCLVMLEAAVRPADIFANSLQTRDSPGKLWIALNLDYHSLGTQEQRDISDIYWDLVNDPTKFLHYSVFVWDQARNIWTTLDTDPLLKMTAEAERRQFAEQWLSQVPDGVLQFYEISTAREEFKKLNLGYVDYGNYLLALAEYPGGLSQFREDQTSHSDDFAGALGDTRWLLRSNGLTGEDLTTALDKWTATGEAFLALTDELH